MTSYVVKRILMAIFTVLIIACITFFIMNMVPGGPFLSEKSPSEAVRRALEAKYGLDKPLIEQLATYLTDFAKGDLGVSLKLQKNREVSKIIFEMFPVSAKLGLVALIVAIVVGVPIGCVAAYYRGSWIDSTLRVVMTLGVSIPGFVVATVLLVVFTVKLNWLPGIGLTSWRHYLMPAFALAFNPMCYIGRITRASMLDAISADYIRTATAKGVKTKTIIFKHALRNSLIPVITYLGPLTAYVITGGFVVEKVFSIPGLGRYFVQSIQARDYPIIMATTIFLASLVVFMNLAVDLLYKLVDPRISLSKGEN